MPQSLHAVLAGWDPCPTSFQIFVKTSSAIAATKLRISQANWNVEVFFVF